MFYDEQTKEIYCGKQIKNTQGKILNSMQNSKATNRKNVKKSTRANPQERTDEKNILTQEGPEAWRAPALNAYTD